MPHAFHLPAHRIKQFHQSRFLSWRVLKNQRDAAEKLLVADELFLVWRVFGRLLSGHRSFPERAYPAEGD
jgi:hypothetical protein